MPTPGQKRDLELPEGARGKKHAESEHWWDRQHSLVLRQSPRWAQALTIGLITLGSGGILASSLIKIDEVITVTGQLKPTAGITEVKAPAGGLIRRVYKSEGDRIEEGEIIVEFDTRKADEEIKNTTKQLKEIERTYESGLRAMKAKKSAIIKSLETNEKILQRMEILWSQGAVEENTLLQQRDRVFSMQVQIQEVAEQMVQNKSNYERTKSELEARQRQSMIQKQYEQVFATSEGIAFQVAASKNGVLPIGETIMKIVPQKKLKGEVSITNKDIGFVQIGQKAQVRVDAFNFTQFGYLNGSIKSIGADAEMPDEENNTFTFPVEIQLERNYLMTDGIQIPLKSGMSITANIKLREKRLISVVSDIFNNNYDALQRLRQ